MLHRLLRSHSYWLLGSVLSAVLTNPLAFAGDEPQPLFNFAQQLTASDGGAEDEFGFSIALAGDIAVVGTFLHDVEDNADQGAVYSYVRGTDGRWTEQQKLLASDGQANDRFGYAVAINGNTLAVGAPGKAINDVRAGAVYVFERRNNRWVAGPMLSASDRVVSDDFGLSLALQDNTLAIGAPGKDYEGKNDPGGVYIFTRSGSGWRERQTLIISSDDLVNEAGSTRFGQALALDNNRLMIGAFLKDEAVPGAGVVYSYGLVDNEWREQQKLTASDPDNTDYFGISVALEGDWLAVGANRKNIEDRTNQGAVYVFSYQTEDATWSEQQRLNAADGGEDDQLGLNIAMANGVIAAGAFQHNVSSRSNQGAAYLFSQPEPDAAWAERQKVLANDGRGEEYFGFSIAMDGDWLLISVPRRTVGDNVGQGAVHAFSKADIIISLPDPIFSDHYERRQARQ